MGEFPEGHLRANKWIPGHTDSSAQSFHVLLSGDFKALLTASTQVFGASSRLLNPTFLGRRPPMCQRLSPKLTSSFGRGGDRGSEMLRNSAKVTELIMGRAGLETVSVFSQSPCPARRAHGLPGALSSRAVTRTGGSTYKMAPSSRSQGARGQDAAAPCCLQRAGLTHSAHLPTCPPACLAKPPPPFCNDSVFQAHLRKPSLLSQHYQILSHTIYHQIIHSPLFQDLNYAPELYPLPATATTQ